MHLILLSAAFSAPPHQEHAALELAPLTRSEVQLWQPSPTPLPDVWVYGYLPYWVGGLDAVVWEGLTHLAIFDVGLNADGSLSDSTRWTSVASEAVSAAEPHGVRVHLTVTCFDEAVMNSVLPDPTRRTRAVDALAVLVDQAGAHGVSVDFEGMDAARRDDLVAFVAELAQQVPELSVATPAVDWSSAYDYAGLAEHSALFIMGYGYHWQGGDPGPVAPLEAGDPWARWSLAWTVGDYLDKGAPADRIILGLPLYGREWPTVDNQVPGSATASGDPVVMTDAVAQAQITGRLWESLTHTPYTFPDSRSQLWYDDTDSVRDKVAWAVEEGLLGVGFWALGYEGRDPAFWQMMAEETHFAGPDEAEGQDSPTDPRPTARAGEPIDAWVGQLVVLNGQGSRGQALSFRWSQISGPQVSLRAADSPTPNFTPRAPGVYTFDLVVADAERSSQPDQVSVRVQDPMPSACSAVADSGPQGPAGLAALVWVWAALLRRR